MLDLDQKGVEVISAVEQGVMLQANLASLVQKRLKILIGLVLVVLAPKDGLDELWVGDRRSTLTTRLGLFLEVLNVLESTQPAGNVSGRKSSPSRAVTTPTISTTCPLSVARGSMRVTSSCLSSKLNDAKVRVRPLMCRRSSSETGMPYT